MRLAGLRVRRDEVNPMARLLKEARRAATLHSGVFHFNGPPGDWLTPAEDPSPFQHNGPLHYLFVLANVLPATLARSARTKPLVSTFRHLQSAINRTSREQRYRVGATTIIISIYGGSSCRNCYLDNWKD